MKASWLYISLLGALALGRALAVEHGEAGLELSAEEVDSRATVIVQREAVAPATRRASRATPRTTSNRRLVQPQAYQGGAQPVLRWRRRSVVPVRSLADAVAFSGSGVEPVSSPVSPPSVASQVGNYLDLGPSFASANPPPKSFAYDDTASHAGASSPPVEETKVAPVSAPVKTEPPALDPKKQMPNESFQKRWGNGTTSKENFFVTFDESAPEGTWVELPRGIRVVKGANSSKLNSDHFVKVSENETVSYSSSNPADKDRKYGLRVETKDGDLAMMWMPIATAADIEKMLHAGLRAKKAYEEMKKMQPRFEAAFAKNPELKSDLERLKSDSSQAYWQAAHSANLFTDLVRSRASGRIHPDQAAENADPADWKIAPVEKEVVDMMITSAQPVKPWETMLADYRRLLEMYDSNS